VWAPRGRVRAIEGLGLLLVLPPVFVGLLWIGANAVIMGNPFDFISGDYGYGSFQSAADSTGAVVYVTGDAVGAVALVCERVFPFLIPLAAVLAVRIADGRLWRINTLSVVLMSLSVPLGMVAPLAFLGSPMGFLRYLIYPLFVAAGWGLYEIALSRRRRVAVALILAGWLLAIPAALWIMSGRLGPEERTELQAVANGLDRTDSVDAAAPIARYLEAEILPAGRNVVFDSVAQGAMVAVQIRPAFLQQLIVTSDRRFRSAITHPGSHDVGYFLMPNPKGTPTAAIGRAYPKLWGGHQAGFRLVATINTQLEQWHVYKVLPNARDVARPTGDIG
jgi:hypothetical protein